MNLNFYSAKNYDNKSGLLMTAKQTQNKPNQTQPVMSLSNLFQTGHILVNRAKTKLLNFHLKNSLTGWQNSLKCWFFRGV